MRQSKALSSKSRVIAGFIATIFAFTALSASMATPSFADIGFGIEDGNGSGGNGVGSGGGSSGSGTGGGGNTGGTGGGGWTDPYAPYWVTSWGGNPYCANKIGVGASIGVSILYQKQSVASNGQPAGQGWIDTGTYSPGYGNIWERTVSLENIQCHYPPRYELVAQQCILSTTATITQKRPSVAQLGSKTNASGYTLGNPSPEACKNSKSSAAVNVNIGRYSLVEAVAVSQAVNQVFKVYIEVDPRTGVVPATELQQQGVPFNLTPKTASISVTCKGVSNPANYALTDFTDNLCNPGNNPGTSTYYCNADPVKFNMANHGSKAKMDSFPNNYAEFMTSHIGNPGVDIVFSQKPSGKDLTINSYKTSYKSSLPYTEMDIKNHLGQAIHKNVLTGTKKVSGNFTGQNNNVNIVYNGATMPDENLNLTQTLEWTGTRLVSMPTITSMDPITGQINITYNTISVPTSGKCEQTAILPVKRAFGDTIN